jgi:hypothetical protein
VRNSVFSKSGVQQNKGKNIGFLIQVADILIFNFVISANEHGTANASSTNEHDESANVNSTNDQHGPTNEYSTNE